MKSWKCLLGRHNWFVCVSTIFEGEKCRLCLDCNKELREFDYIKQKAFFYGALIGLAIGVAILLTLILENL